MENTFYFAHIANHDLRLNRIRSILDGGSCVRYELKEESQQISNEEVMEKYTVQGTSSKSYPLKIKLKP